MFGGAPPPPSKEELALQEQQATRTIQNIILASLALYLSPFAVDYIQKLA